MACAAPTGFRILTTKTLDFSSNAHWPKWLQIKVCWNNTRLVIVYVELELAYCVSNASKQLICLIIVVRANENIINVSYKDMLITILLSKLRINCLPNNFGREARKIWSNWYPNCLTILCLSNYVVEPVTKNRSRFDFPVLLRLSFSVERPRN